MLAQPDQTQQLRSRDQAFDLVYVDDEQKGLKFVLCTPVTTLWRTVRGVFSITVQSIGICQKREKSVERQISTQLCIAQPGQLSPVRTLAACQTLPAVYVYSPAPANASATAHRYRHRIT